MKWLIVDDEIIKCIKEIRVVLDKYNFPQILETAILEDLKLGLWNEIHKEFRKK